ncbi:MAG: MBOAT family O-acyltransferase [Gallintestinimicrobium sp.]
MTSAEVRDSHAWYLILYPMAAVGAVWGAAILIDRTKEQKKKLAALICAVLFCVGLLCTLKFFHLGLLAPMGISFYTLTLLGYLFDVYYEIGPVQRNYGKLLLFCCYFPTMISGPIMKYSDMEKQMYAGHKLDYRNVTFGMQRMLLGFFKKLVISERTAILANEIFNNYEKYSGVSIWVGAAAFTMQLYTDFDGCMDIVLGISECFGIRLPENFSAPFLSRSIEEYWRRWHISLGDWLKNYLFYPLLRTKFFMNLPKKLKGKLGKKRREAGDDVSRHADFVVYHRILARRRVDVYHRLRSAALVLYRFRQADGAAVCKVESLFSYRKGKERIYPVSARAHLFPCHDRTCLFQKRDGSGCPSGARTGRIGPGTAAV